MDFITDSVKGCQYDPENNETGLSMPVFPVPDCPEKQRAEQTVDEKVNQFIQQWNPGNRLRVWMGRIVKNQGAEQNDRHPVQNETILQDRFDN